MVRRIRIRAGQSSGGAGGARTHDRRIMSPRASSSRESGTDLTWEYEPARSLLDPGELQLELQLQLKRAGRADALQHAAAPTRCYAHRSRPPTGDPGPQRDWSRGLE